MSRRKSGPRFRLYFEAPVGLAANPHEDFDVPDTGHRDRHPTTRGREQAYRAWRQYGCAPDLSEYQDAALTALTGCLSRYINTGKSFSSYAYPRLCGATQDVPEQYRCWHIRRPVHRTSLPHAWALVPVIPSMEEAVTFRLAIQRLQPAWCSAGSNSSRFG